MLRVGLGDRRLKSFWMDDERARRAALGWGMVLCFLLSPIEARASSIDSSGKLIYAKGALLTFGFESLAGARAIGASWLTWSTASSASLSATPVSSPDWGTSLVTGDDALEGTYALRLSAASGYLGVGLLDTALFTKIASRRVIVSMWGRSHGAEPELDIVYPSTTEPIGPTGFGHIVAIRTGNETSDGWAEYSTGPIDGSVWGKGIAALILTARYPTTTTDTLPLDSSSFFPSGSGPTLVDDEAFALVDAVEIDEASGAPMAPSSCTQATVDSSCGDLGECVFGHCVDGTLLWGPAPTSADHRRDLVRRWEFLGEHLGADRLSASQAPSVFTPSLLATIEGATTPRTFVGAMSERVAELRDGHTDMGSPPSEHTIFYPYVDPFYNASSGILDMCLGLAEDDLPGGSGANVYAAFWVSPTSMLAGALTTGAELVQVDGLTPDAWMDAVEPRFRQELPNDPTSEPSGRAIIFSSMLARYAQAAVFSTCTLAGVCSQKTVSVGQMAYEWVRHTKYTGATTGSRTCTPRFLNSVSTWTPGDDSKGADVPVYETVSGITSIEVNGFRGIEDKGASNPWHAWEDPFTAAFALGNNVIIDFRQGHGGHFPLGNFLAHNIRGTSNPYGAFSVPRGAFDEIDAAWLFDSSLQSCVLAPFEADNLCGWTAGEIDESMQANPPFGGVKIAWLNGNDMSQNDITPGKIVGLPNVRVFAPHASSGAFGEVSYLPPVLGPWLIGSTQVLDFRYGASLPLAMAASWSSGVGVQPDQVVTEKMSDLLAGQDTILLAARAWLEAP
jgi:hypothetical protein